MMIMYSLQPEKESKLLLLFFLTISSPGGANGADIIQYKIRITLKILCNFYVGTQICGM